ncbi:MAG TPA: exodeoxyribonuclease VII small subunit [Acholeplasma sp.]|nr:exodeoxyribonuclease VII small subunit [Acholeplasma sp.]
MDKLSFEQALEKLEKVVKGLEDKDIALDDAVKMYNEGLELSKLCYKLISSSEKLVVKQMTEQGDKLFEIE